MKGKMAKILKRGIAAFLVLVLLSSDVCVVPAAESSLEQVITQTVNVQDLLYERKFQITSGGTGIYEDVLLLRYGEEASDVMNYIPVAMYLNGTEEYLSLSTSAEKGEVVSCNTKLTRDGAEQFVLIKDADWTQENLSYYIYHPKSGYYMGLNQNNKLYAYGKEKPNQTFVFKKTGYSDVGLLTTLDGYSQLSEANQKRVLDIYGGIGARSLFREGGWDTDKTIERALHDAAVDIYNKKDTTTAQEQADAMLESMKLAVYRGQAGYYELKNIPGTNGVETTLSEGVEDTYDFCPWKEGINLKGKKYTFSVISSYGTHTMTVYIQNNDVAEKNGQNLLEAIKQIPYPVRKNIKTMTVYNDDENTLNCGENDLWIRMNWVETPNGIAQFLAHEFGHSMDFSYTVNSSGSWDKAREADILNVSDYGTTNGYEDFAEFSQLYFQMYGNYNGMYAIRQLYPNRYRLYVETLQKADYEDIYEEILYLPERKSLGSLERSAEVKASYCSEWEKKTAVNDGETGSTSLGSDCSHWGTWGNTEATEEWISYEWSTPVCIDTSQVYFFDDGAGVQVPSSYRYEYLNENGKWTEIPNQQGLETKKDQYNVTTFDAVVTKGIRAVLVKQADGVGINEWKVSGKPVPDQNNLSESADIKVSYCSGWEKETAVNDGETGSASLGSDCSHWGTWGNNEATEEWISYEWAVPVYIDRSEIYFFDNSNGGDGGVQVPSSYRYEYLNENGEWTEMPNQQGLETKQDQYNVTTFDTVKTKGIRAILVKQADGVGINEWKVSGKAVTEPAAEKGVLKAAIDAEVNAEDTYTAESWKVYADALAGAKEIYNRKDASQAEVDAAADALTEAVKALTRKPERPFVDVEAGSWYYDAVYYNYDRMIIAGMDETHFEPETKLTRAQFAIMLHRMSGRPEAVYEARFSDVTEGAWYADSVMWASENGIITGYADGSRRFGPEDNINREQVAVMMYRYARSQGYDVSVTADYSTYADAASVNVYAKEAVGWAVGEGILTGKEMGTRIDPQGSATRAECAVMFQRLMEKLLKK